MPESAPIDDADSGLVTAVKAAADVIGDRWSLPVLAALSAGAGRFSDLQTALDGVAPNVLSRRLTDLERAGLIVGRPYQRRPLRLAYELTDRGEELIPVLMGLASWVRTPGGPVHSVCGTPLEARWFCPSCDVGLDHPDDGLIRA